MVWLKTVDEQDSEWRLKEQAATEIASSVQQVHDNWHTLLWLLAVPENTC